MYLGCGTWNLNVLIQKVTFQKQFETYVTIGSDSEPINPDFGPLEGQFLTVWILKATRTSDVQFFKFPGQAAYGLVN